MPLLRETTNSLLEQNLLVAWVSTVSISWLSFYVGEDDVSLNEQMITEGYAWEYDGGTKKKDFEELRRSIR